MKKQKQEAEEQVVEIVAAEIKDDLLDYSFDIVQGIGVGDNAKIKGKGVIDEELRYAFAELNVHLACIDDAFKSMKDKEFKEIKTHERTTLYQVKGFKIKGGADDLSVILIGSKHVSASGDRMNLETPRIPVDNSSSYKWYRQLKAVIKTCREEVEAYRCGKCTPQELVTEDSNQLKITDQDLEDGKVK